MNMPKNQRKEFCGLELQVINTRMRAETISSITHTVTTSTKTPERRRKGNVLPFNEVLQIPHCRPRSQSLPFDSPQMLPDLSSLDSRSLKITSESKSEGCLTQNEHLQLPRIEHGKRSVVFRGKRREVGKDLQRKNQIDSSPANVKNQQSPLLKRRTQESKADNVSGTEIVLNRLQQGGNGTNSHLNSTAAEDTDVNPGKWQPSPKRLLFPHHGVMKDDLLDGNRPRSRSTTIPPVYHTRSDIGLRYPLATRYLRRWARKVRSDSKVMKTELENLKEDSEEGYSQTCVMELLSRFPSSPEFAQVLHELCREVQGLTTL